jgi:hypothetical protein
MSAKLKQEWERYCNHFTQYEHSETDQHAFYMGVLMGLFWSKQLKQRELRLLARELDAFMSSGECLCMACEQAKRNGTFQTVEQQLFE